jgi:hypothetical protein
MRLSLSLSLKLPRLKLFGVLGTAPLKQEAALEA